MLMTMRERERCQREREMREGEKDVDERETPMRDGVS